MKRPFKSMSRPLSVFVLMLSALGSGTAFAARSEPWDIDDNLRAQVIREEIRQKREMAGSYGRNTAQDSAACGNVDIGNDDSSRRSGQLDRNRPIIIAGNVINAAHCR